MDLAVHTSIPFISIFFFFLPFPIKPFLSAFLTFPHLTFTIFFINYLLSLPYYHFLFSIFSLTLFVLLHSKFLFYLSSRPYFSLFHFLLNSTHFFCLVFPCIYISFLRISIPLFFMLTGKWRMSC